jgi:hypothetical protein
MFLEICMQGPRPSHSQEHADVAMWWGANCLYTNAEELLWNNITNPLKPKRLVCVAAGLKLKDLHFAHIAYLYN